MPELFPTPHRKAFLRAVASSRTRIVRYRSTNEAWDQQENARVTSRLSEAYSAGWVEPVPDEDLWRSAEPRTRVIYYRLTEAGKALIGKEKSE